MTKKAPFEVKIPIPTYEDKYRKVLHGLIDELTFEDLQKVGEHIEGLFEHVSTTPIPQLDGYEQMIAERIGFLRGALRDDNWYAVDYNPKRKTTKEKDKQKQARKAFLTALGRDEKITASLKEIADNTPPSDWDNKINAWAKKYNFQPEKWAWVIKSAKKALDDYQRDKNLSDDEINVFNEYQKQQREAHLDAVGRNEDTIKQAEKLFPERTRESLTRIRFPYTHTLSDGVGTAYPTAKGDLSYSTRGALPFDAGRMFKDFIFPPQATGWKKDIMKVLKNHVDAFMDNWTKEDLPYRRGTRKKNEIKNEKGEKEPTKFIKGLKIDAEGLKIDPPDERRRWDAVVKNHCHGMKWKDIVVNLYPHVNPDKVNEDETEPIRDLVTERLKLLFPPEKSSP